MINLPSNPGTGEGTEEEESREEAKGSIGMNTFQDSSSVTEHLFQAEDHAQPSEGILINSRQVYSQGDKSVNSSVKSDMQGDNLSYKEFLIALYRTNGAPQLLILCVFLSFGFGTLGIVSQTKTKNCSLQLKLNELFIYSLNHSLKCDFNS